MLTSISEFEFLWTSELEATQKIFKHLTNKSLVQAVTPQHRTLGRLAWHITTSIPEMMSRTGLKIAGPSPDAPVPSTAKEIFSAYNDAAISLLEQIKDKWTDSTLQVEDEMYGSKWKRCDTLEALIRHQIHHRGQMTVLMRQAGLNVPGIYGPAKEEWAAYGASPPEV
jgi:uncharacterized damage-inducible protein DinB